jgi:glycosyltransferase involved in cell wall biosynthesis
VAPIFSIVTPSYRSSPWLKLCLASVADQQVELEHIVQDAGSDDGTLDWLVHDPRAKVFVEKDTGMYDAINRGLRRTQGEFLAYLNCDEQYLPGTLLAVHEFFLENPGVDLVFGHIVMINRQGNYLYHRKVQTPLKFHTWTCQLSTLSCAMFFRRRVIFEQGFFFNPDWRAAGDGEWMVRLLQRNIRMAALGQFTSVFTCTGNNLGDGEDASQERLRLAASAPGFVRACKPAIVLHHRLRRLCGGMYFQEPFSFAIFTIQDPVRRQVIKVGHPTFRPPA